MRTRFNSRRKFGIQFIGLYVCTVHNVIDVKVTRSCMLRGDKFSNVFGMSCTIRDVPDRVLCSHVIQFEALSREVRG